jgi:hypothetical protein
MDEPRKVKEPCSYDSASFLSRWFFIYVLPVFKIGNRGPLEFSDLPSQPAVDEPIALTNKLER